MRIYVRDLSMGELPVHALPDYYDGPILTIGDDGQVMEPRWDVGSDNPNDPYVRPGRKVCAHEHWFVEEHMPWFEHEFDVSEEIARYDASLKSIRPVIRRQLVDWVRPMCTKSVLVFVRGYQLMMREQSSYFFVAFAAGVLGVNFEPNPFWWKGPQWDSDFEMFVDNVRDGAEIPEGMKRYGITPRGKIINPLPPTCKTCEMRHYGDSHRLDFGQWVEKIEVNVRRATARARTGR